MAAFDEVTDKEINYSKENAYFSNNEQLFFEIEVNSGRIFTSISKNCFSIYSRSDLNNICRRKQSKVDLIDISIHVWKTCKRHKACVIVFTEASNMVNLNNLR